MTAPHLAVPFRLLATGAVTVAQDSPAEVAQCVAAILGTRPGSRGDFPDMGIEDPAFAGLDLDQVRAQIEEYEPRAEILADSTIEGLVQKVSVSVSALR